MSINSVSSVSFCANNNAAPKISKEEKIRESILNSLNKNGMSKDEYVDSCKKRKKIATGVTIGFGALSLFNRSLILAVPAIISAFAIKRNDDYIKVASNM